VLDLSNGARVASLRWVGHMGHRMTVLGSVVTVSKSAAHCGVDATGDGVVWCHSC
jgi:hypothetical protein